MKWLAITLTLCAAGAVIVPPADAVTHSLILAPVGEAAGDGFGVSVSTAGDVNGDGFDDIIVGAWANDAGGADAGRAYVYYGGPGADSTADLTLTGEAAGDWFYSVGTAGDVNGDGFDDLIVGAPHNDAGGEDAGRVYVYYGGPGADTTPDLTITGELGGLELGDVLGTAGDVNGDGFDDMIVGTVSPRGAFLYYGGSDPDSLPDLNFNDAGPYTSFGRCVGTAGDVNGDGFDDVIIGAPGQIYYDPGHAYVFYGGSETDTTADLIFTGETGGDEFGRSVATAGDVNGDGFDDVVVGAWLNGAGGADAGRAYVYYGGPGADTTADLTFTGEAAGDYFGFQVGTAGDLNGDGFDDLLIAAYGNDAGGADAGAVYVYYGAPVMDTTPDTILTGEAAGDHLSAIGTAGDVDGDGFDDFIVGASGNDAGGTDAGRAYVYASNSQMLGIPKDSGQTPSVVLAPPHPNPLRSTSTMQVAFELPRAGKAELGLFDVRGRKVARRAAEHFEAGASVVSWELPRLASGVYFLSLSTGGRSLASTRFVIID